MGIQGDPDVVAEMLGRRLESWRSIATAATHRRWGRTNRWLIRSGGAQE